MTKDTDDIFALAFAHETVVDMDTDQLLADCLNQQSRNDRGVNTAGQRQQNLLVANLRANRGNLLFNKCICLLRSGNTLHGLGTYIARHKSCPPENEMNGFIE